ncbi:MAG: hypothetical protein R3C26_03295 [Calditrichia bacterium]
MSRQLEVETCLSCHLESEGVSERMTHTSSFIGGYKTSVHGRKFLGRHNCCHLQRLPRCPRRTESRRRNVQS